MRFRSLLLAALGLLLAFTSAARAQESGPWRASSSNARAITGDIFFSPLKITINFTNFTIAQIRSLRTQEVRALFNPDNPIGGGNLFRVDIPSDKRFLHKNTLCGSDSTEWIVTYAQGRDLQVAFFSGATPPVLTVDALNDAPNLCGVFSYIR
ncbi:MAG TPA: hypothetical protein VFA99_01135 [Acidobacteriaceae bacterium]|nr:hypothetical protein [Acidobacteriaceae bacterium]